MRRLLGGLTGVYLLFAVIGRFVEGMGATTCGCAQECWCRRRGLRLFRWVFPVRHRGLAHSDVTDVPELLEVTEMAA
jgi:hypothetical protein